MILSKAHVQNYRSIIDSGEFEIEELKTILVGPNEAGKTVLLKALQQLNKPEGVSGFDALRDYPRSLYNDITTGKIDIAKIEVVKGYFTLEEEDKALVPDEYKKCQYVLSVNLNNKRTHHLENAPKKITYNDLKKDLIRLTSHLDKKYTSDEDNPSEDLPSKKLDELTSGWYGFQTLSTEKSQILILWLEGVLQYVDEENETEEKRYDKLVGLAKHNQTHNTVLKTLEARIPVFVYFNNYFRVKPSIHLEHLADRVEQNILDDEYYDYGNLCLLKLLGFTSRELSDIGNTPSPNMDKREELQEYKDNLDKRSYQLNSASVRLTQEIRSVWKPDPKRPEADKLKITADGQYLKVVVEDDMGVDIELDQRSEGFQWLVSFFVVFFAEAMDKHSNSILLLDEPAMSLHGLKQREFRETISRLAENNQTIYSTHSPFLVGSNELDLVRVVEMKERKEGTKVHLTLSSSDPAGLLPLQEAFGYDLAQSLFAQQRNLVLEGLTDYWYIDATAQLLRADGVIDLNEKIALVFANTAGKVVYYATILHAHKLKVAALLDSDNAGDKAAEQENLVHALGNKNILRTKDFCSLNVPKSEIEDLLRETLIKIVNEEYGVDTSSIATSQSTRPIVDIFTSEVPKFSKYKLAKAYVRWTRSKTSSDLTNQEKEDWKKMINKVNTVLK